MALALTLEPTAGLAGDNPSLRIGRSLLVKADCFEWLKGIPENSLHAIVTDPPYGVKEFEDDQIEKRARGKGGIWRIPPSFDGHMRSPLPRFTALNPNEREVLKQFFLSWSKLVVRALRPGAHVFIANNAFVSQMVFSALVEGGLEFRGELIRLVQTLRGGDRPKNAEEAFPGVCSMPRGSYEPWGILRKPMPPRMRVSDCLERYQTGGLRRTIHDLPFCDVIPSERTPRRERQMANHPSIKPQSFLRQVVHASLPLGEGVVADPFMGSGSTIAAAEAIGVSAVGIERNEEFYTLATKAVSKLAAIDLDCRKKIEPSRSRDGDGHGNGNDDVHRVSPFKHGCKCMRHAHLASDARCIGLGYARMNLTNFKQGPTGTACVKPSKLTIRNHQGDI